MDPENFAVEGQLLGERKKSIKSPKDNHYQDEYFASAFLSDGFRSNQQHDPIRDVLKCFILSDVPIGGPAQSNLRDDEPEKEQCWQVQGVLRQLNLPGGELLSRPNNEQQCCTSLEGESRPFIDRPEGQYRKNQEGAKAENENPLQDS